ncbi:MAG: hypothetical protein ACRDNG_15295 [Gaiellaceae bacterium]
MRISLIRAPYWLGNAEDPLATGPTRIVEEGALEALREAGHDVELVAVEKGDRESEDVYWNEIESSFAVMRQVAYDPSADAEGEVPRVAVRLLGDIVEAAA